MKRFIKNDHVCCITEAKNGSLCDVKDAEAAKEDAYWDGYIRGLKNGRSGKDMEINGLKECIDELKEKAKLVDEAGIDNERENTSKAIDKMIKYSLENTQLRREVLELKAESRRYANDAKRLYGDIQELGSVYRRKIAELTKKNEELKADAMSFWKDICSGNKVEEMKHRGGYG